MSAEDRIAALELEAKRVLERLREEKRSRPLIVEFSGTPKAGKSTIINSLRLFLARNDFDAFVLTERASTSPIRDKTHPFFNAWTASTTLAQMLEAGQKGAPHDVVIMDRGLYDALAWMRWLENSGQMKTAHKEIIDDFITLDLWVDMIDLVFVMKVSPSEALQREFKGQVTHKPGTIMNDETIRDFNSALDEMLKDKGDKRFIEVDSTGEDPQDTSYKVVKSTLQALDQAIGA